MPAENATSQPEVTALETADHLIGLDGTGWVTVPTSAIRAALQPVLTKTANHTLTLPENGSLVTNAGASGTVVLTLPAATVGLEYRGHVRAAFALRFDPNGSEVIGNPTAGSADGGAGKYIGSSTVGAAIHLVCSTAGRWEVQSVKGTWTLEA
jgi:hypothetical protein